MLKTSAKNVEQELLGKDFIRIILSGSTSGLDASLMKRHILKVLFFVIEDSSN